MGTIAGPAAAAEVAYVGGIQAPLAGKPRITHTGTVAPDTVCLMLRSQAVEHGKQIPYKRLPQDEIVLNKQHRLVRRGGEMIGALAGEGGEILFTPDRLVGEPLDTAWADRAESYRIQSQDDARYAEGLAPVAVHRKTKPIDLCRMPARHQSAAEHWLFLKLPQPLEQGATYRVVFQGDALAEPESSFTYDPTIERSEAVHVSHVGFRPDDPVKIAFLSCWMGGGGGLPYKEGLPFQVLDDKSGEAVFAGRTRLSKSKEQPEHDGKNHVAADVYAMDFSLLHHPGTYRISVEGVGCSFPFKIAEDAWLEAFRVSLTGLLHHRSGIALGPPLTEYRRPRSFHPDDGVKVFQSTFSHDQNPKQFGGTFRALMLHKTDEVLPEAWGGYMDAGDWDRRPGHIRVPRLLLELFELRPQYFESVALRIPESSDDLPDVLNEALWGLDLFHRLQRPDGGVRSGIESEEHPRRGECSWQETLTVMAFGPNPDMSYDYAGVAARAAYILRQRRPQLAQSYLESAVRAYQWAADRSEGGGSGALAAAELFRATGDEKWHKRFLEATAFKDAAAEITADSRQEEHGEAGWVYLRTECAGKDEQVLANYRRALLADAEKLLQGCDSTAFRWAARSNQVINWGALTVPQAISLVRALHLTGDEKYLKAALLACQAGAGANPLNMCFTTGVGHRWPQHVLHEDSRITHQLPPTGITVGGPRDPWHFRKDRWVARGQFISDCYPPGEKWPSAEAYWDVFGYAPMCEYTVHNTITPNAYVWGYLAARQ
ncbi:MAG: glycoside hydrolase family 9 protein [Planctomycetota bacterium]